VLASAFGALLSGCAGESKTASDSAATTPREVELRLLVVDDPALAAAIDRVKGEWKARSGATVSIAQAAAVDLASADSPSPSADAVIYPSWLLGTLAQRGWLAPLPGGYAQNRELAWSDTFELSQVAETRWGQAVMAVPLGSPVFTCYYRLDLFERFRRQPPRTWEEYHELAKFFGRRENLEGAAPPADAAWHGCAEPLAKGWAGRMLLARAAAYVRHRDHYSTLFKIDTMEPLVAGAGFVRALEELVADAKLGPADPLALDPDAAREEFMKGRCALAVSWPAHAASSTVGEPAEEQPPLGFVELPGSTAVYNFALASWENRRADENIRVPLLCVSGRLGSVSAEAAQRDGAFRLLAWLSGNDWGSKIGATSSASPATTLYRRSQLRAPMPWVDAGTDAQAARQYATSIRDALSRQAYLFALRMPGNENYLAALDAAVAEAVRGEATAAGALAKAAAEWTKITDALGRDAQRKAYRQSLGLEP
jgi:multiple sugar transport system substrate-binding protein